MFGLVTTRHARQQMALAMRDLAVEHAELTRAFGDTLAIESPDLPVVHALDALADAFMAGGAVAGQMFIRTATPAEQVMARACPAFDCPLRARRSP